MFTLDFLPEIPGLAKFKDSYKNKEVATLDDIPIPFINYDDLVTNKQATTRPQDINDIEQLKSARK